MDGEPVITKSKKPLTNGFIPKLMSKKVTIRLVSGGQPITGTVEGYNPYEIIIQTAKGQVLVFKHSIATIEPVDVLKPQDFLMRG
jgi:RNA chaperone Hfq